MCTLGVLVCIAIVEPSEGTIAVCSVGMFLHFVFKDIHGIVIESYGPELSHKLSEVSTAITAGAGAFYIFTILTLVIWVGIGMVLSPITYGTTISVVTGVMMMIFTYMGYSRLPNVPAANELPPDTSLVTYTFIRFKALAVQVYHEFPDLGVVLLSSMVGGAGPRRAICRSGAYPCCEVLLFSGPGGHYFGLWNDRCNGGGAAVSVDCFINATRCMGQMC